MSWRTGVLAQKKKEGAMARRIGWYAFVFVVLFQFQPNAFGVVAVRQPFGEQFADADIVALGTVINAEGRWADGQIITTVTLEVEQFLKGTSATPLTFNFLGGIAPDGMVMHPSGMPTVEVGDDVLVLLRFHEGQLWLANASLGYWRIIKESGRRQASRDLREVRFLLAPGRFSKAAFEAGDIEKTPLETLLPKNIIIGPSQKRGGLAKTFVRNQVPAGRYVWWGIGDMPVRFKLNYRVYAALGFFDGLELEATFRHAVSRWTAVPGSYLAMAYDGPTTVAPEKLDFMNVVSTKGLSAINPLILARATWWGYRQTGQIADCDVVFNSDRRELARMDVVEAAWSHELGHCTGLSHSADRSALMYEERINNRGPELAQDDIFGLLRIYPTARRPVSDGVPEVYIWPPTSALAAGIINLEIHLLNAGGRERLREVYLGANGVNYAWIFLQYTAQVAYAAPHGWVLQFPAIGFPQPGYSSLRITVCLTNDRGAGACQDVTYTRR